MPVAEPPVSKIFIDRIVERGPIARLKFRLIIGAG